MATVPYDTLVLERRVARQFAEVSRLVCTPALFRGGLRVDLGHNWILTLEHSFGVDFGECGTTVWISHATIARPFRPLRAYRAKLEIGCWDTDGSTSRLSVRPCGRPDAWGAHRVAAWWAVGHHVADAWLCALRHGEPPASTAVAQRPPAPKPWTGSAEQSSFPFKLAG
jgi:hypothetical protein